MSGKLYLIVGPSGAGKGTIIEAIKKNRPDIFFPLSCTTRDMRPGEEEGIVYNFISKEDFLKKIEDGDFLEWAHVHSRDNFYGTLKAPILKALEEGKKVLREVDMQGVESITKIIEKSKLSTIFITVANWETLEKRIIKRSPMSEDEINRRKLSFIKEMEFSKNCDYIIHSEDGKIEESINEVLKIIDE